MCFIYTCLCTFVYARGQSLPPLVSLYLFIFWGRVPQSVWNSGIQLGWQFCELLGSPRFCLPKHWVYTCMPPCHTLLLHGDWWSELRFWALFQTQLIEISPQPTPYPLIKELPYSYPNLTVKAVILDLIPVLPFLNKWSLIESADTPKWIISNLV